VKVAFLDPKGKKLFEMENNFVFQDGKERLRTIINIDNLPLTESGEYTFSIMTRQNDIDFEEIDAVPLKINIEMKRN
jgi:hypothetical protein